MERLFFDISDIALYIQNHRSITGIQRVVVMIITRIAQSLDPEKIYLSWHRTSETPYLTCPASDLLDALNTFDVDKLGQAFGVSVAKHPSEVMSGISPVQLRMAKVNLAIASGASTGETNFGLRFFDVARSGDRLCGLGRSWGQPHLEETYLQAARRGVSVHLLIHDLIPLKFPHLANPGSSLSYYEWLSESPNYCSSYLTNSFATATDLENFFSDFNLRPPIHVTPLAQQRLLVTPEHLNNPLIPLKHSHALSQARTVAELDPLVREATIIPYVLCVGTIEPRKNLWRLVQAWTKLVREDICEIPRLILAGRRGWLTDSFLDMLTRTGGMNGWVIHLNAPTDTELDYLVRHCTRLIAL